MLTTSDGTSQPGTPSYQAPEVLLDRRSGNASSDMWSIGCTLLELFLEVPAWKVPVDADPVVLIVSRMKEKVTRLNARLCRKIQSSKHDGCVSKLLLLLGRQEKTKCFGRYSNDLNNVCKYLRSSEFVLKQLNKVFILLLSLIRYHISVFCDFIDYFHFILGICCQSLICF
jgi:serine/threonine protein kinase